MTDEAPIILKFKPLAMNLSREAFSCGDHDIDRWFRKKAWDHHNSLQCRVHTAFSEDGQLLGFYAFCVTVEEERFLDRNSHLKKHAIRRSFPALQVHYLGVQKEHQGKKIGTILMGRIIDIFREAASTLGLPVMTLRAINDRAARLYSRMGFVKYGGTGSKTMLLPARSRPIG